MRSLLPLLLVLSACSTETAPAPASKGGALEPYLAATPEAGSVTVLAARASAKAGDELVLQGRVKDFVGGLAAFTLIDPSLRACSDEGDPMEDSCETPWDYCCIPGKEVAAACATVEFRDAAGVLKQPIEGFHGLAHLDTVIVRGTAQTDASGNLTLVAKSFTFTPNPPRKN